MSEKEIRSIGFGGKIQGGAGIEFISAEMPVDRHPSFVLIRHSLYGQLQDLGLRLDMDKRVIIDHFGDEKKDKVIREATLKICDFLADTLRSELGGERWKE